MDINGVNEKLRSVFKNYHDGEIRRSFRDKFKIQQKNQPEAHRLKNRMVELSKIGIEAVRSGDKAETELCYEESLTLMEELTNLDLDLLPGFKRDRCGEAGQEFVELVFVILLYPVIINNEDVPNFPDPYELYVSLPAYLAGIQDSISEIGKLLDDFILDKKIGFQEEYALKERFVSAATKIYDTLFHEFAGVPQNIINNSWAREYRQSFNGHLGGMRSLIRRIKEDMIQIRYRL